MSSGLSDQPLHRAPLPRIVDNDAHQTSVHVMHQNVPACNDVYGIPVTSGQLCQFLRITDARQNNRLSCTGDSRDVPALRKKTAGLSPLVIAGVPPLPVDIALVPAHRIAVGRSHFVRHHHAAVIDSAVASGCNAKVDLQFEVSRLPWGDFAHHAPLPFAGSSGRPHIYSASLRRTRATTEARASRRV